MTQKLEPLTPMERKALIADIVTMLEISVRVDRNGGPPMPNRMAYYRILGRVVDGLVCDVVESDSLVHLAESITSRSRRLGS